MTALRLVGVTFTYPGASARAIDSVSLEVRAGEGVALLGPNGAGKTTLTRLAMALLYPGSGTVETVGRDTRGRGPEHLADVAGYLFQQPESQLFERTVRDEVAFGPRQLGWNAGRVAERVGAVLEELGLAGSAGVHPYDLPAPRRRLVALAATLVADPVLLLLDEPSAGLDRTTRHTVERALRARLARGTAILAVTHDAAFASELLGRALVLDRGVIVADAPLADALRFGLPGIPAPPAHLEIAERMGLTPKSLRMGDVAVAVAERVGRRSPIPPSS